MTNLISTRAAPVSLRKRFARWRKFFIASYRREDNQARTQRMIAESGLFDADWYLERYPDVAAAGLDPLEHFSTHGGREGRKASPKFDSRWYTDNHDDVASSGLHPMIHFLLHGEGRQTTKRVGIRGVKASPGDFKDAAEILASRLFDAVWYAQQHALETNDQATALHYLKIGSPAGFPASPQFDGKAYLKAYSDVRDSKQNPLLHFIRHGRFEGRKSFAVNQVDTVAFTPFAPRAARRIVQPDQGALNGAADWLTSSRLKSSSRTALILLGGVRTGLLPEVYDGNTSPFPDSLRSALDQFCALRGQDRAAFAVARIGRSPRRVPDLPFPDQIKSPVITDGWFINENVLRLRFETPPKIEGGVRLLQTSPEGMAVLVGESSATGGHVHLIDANLVNHFQPILIAYVSDAGVLTGGSLIAYPSLFRGGAHAGEVEVYPGATDAAKREGLSASLAAESLDPQRQGEFAVSTIKVDLRGATGAERMFRPAVQQWLAELGVTIEPVRTESESESGSDVVRDHLIAVLSRMSTPSPRGRASTLTLPCDALPALSILTSRIPTRGGRRIGAYVMSDSSTPAPRWLVSMPVKDEGLLDLQPAGAPLPYPVLTPAVTRSSTPDRRTGLLAIRFRDPPPASEPILNYPVAPDITGSVLGVSLSPNRASRASIAALLLIDDPLAGASMLESLARQSLAPRMRLVVSIRGSEDSADTIDGIAGRLFPGRYNIVPQDISSAATLNAAAVSVPDQTEMLLIVRQDMVLHDIRTLETLYLLASRAKTASASCVRIREGGFSNGAHLQFQSGGIFPAQISFESAPTLAFNAPETAGAFPLATYPVAGNDLGLVMIPNAAWKALGGLDAEGHPVEGYGLDFALRALKGGYGHLCTSAVTATDVGAAAAPSAVGHPGADALDIGEWAHALDGVAILRTLG